MRESIFNVLGAYYGMPGTLPELHVADVFAGGGSMGLEALSRGAATCRFFERDPAALRALEENLQHLQVGPEAHIHRHDAWSAHLTGVRFATVDLVLLDPPYAATRDVTTDGHVGRLLLANVERVAADAVVVLHHEAKVVFEDAAFAGWRVVKRRSIGSNGLTVFKRHE